CSAFGRGCGVFTTIGGLAPNRDFYIEWRTTYSGVGLGTANFEVVLHENSSSFDVLYGITADMGSAEVSGAQETPSGRPAPFPCPPPTPPTGLKVTSPCPEAPPPPPPTAPPTATPTATFTPPPSATAPRPPPPPTATATFAPTATATFTPT